MDDLAKDIFRGARVMTVNGNNIYGDETVAGNHNILIGENTVAAPDALSNTIIAENVKVAAGVENVVSIGIPNHRITRSNFTEIGSFLYFDAQTKTLKLLNDAIVAEKDGPVRIGGDNGLVINRKSATQEGGVEMIAPLRLAGRGANGGNGWSFGLAPSENAPDPSDPVSDQMRDLVLKSDNGATIVFSDQFTPAVTNFTGQHRCVLRQAVDHEPGGTMSSEPPVGTVLVATGDYCGLDGEDVTVDEAIPIVRVSTRARDARVFGVMSSVEDAGPVRRVRVGNLAFDRPKLATERRVVVNGSGEGGILVCGEGGNIINGDYLCSSSRPGLAMRQSQPYQCTFTCGKSTTSVAFASERSANDAVMVGCIYA